MVLDAPGRPLAARQIALRDPRPGEVLVRVTACGVCRTDLHVVDGELDRPKLPLVLGHEVVGRVAAVGPGVERLRTGQRVGVPWLGATCGHCAHCLAGRENLCDAPAFTGYDRDGGYAGHMLADAGYVFALPDAYDDAHAAPLLCAGLIGYRALRFVDEARTLGIYGFGAAAHLIAQLAIWQGRRVFAFTRAGDAAGQDFARALGCAWAGDSTQAPPEPLDAAVLFAPVGSLVPAALRAVRKAGIVVCGGIHMSDIPSFPYDILWGERVIRSVANLTRRDGEEFLALAPRVPVRTHVQTWPLGEANEALAALRAGRVQGAAVLLCP
ncbi:MAG: zinc-dependent alcohol dehydrogenase family protein [Burkholderiales bacterium]|nr:zinc-dependent alcohol dehydrogenase family protein [Burkholderiales bacterium]